MSTSFSTRQQHTGFSGLHFLFSRVAKDIWEIFFGLLFEKLFVNHHSIFHILIFYAQQLMLCIVLLTWTIGGHSGWFPSQSVWMHWRSSSISPVRLFALTSETLSFPRHSYVCMYVYIYFFLKSWSTCNLRKLQSACDNISLNFLKSSSVSLLVTTRELRCGARQKGSGNQKENFLFGPFPFQCLDPDAVNNPLIMSRAASCGIHFPCTGPLCGRKSGISTWDSTAYKCLPECPSAPQLGCKDPINTVQKRRSVANTQITPKGQRSPQQGASS